MFRVVPSRNPALRRDSAYSPFETAFDPFAVSPRLRERRLASPNGRRSFPTDPPPRPRRSPHPQRTASTVLAVLIGVLSACKPLPKADLTVLNGNEPSSLDPLLVTGIEELRAVLPLFEGLTRPDPQTARPLPGIAERWEISPDGRLYDFHLRTNAAWSTGRPILAEDVAYSWRRVLEPTNGCQYSNLLFPVLGGEDYLTGRTRDPATVGIR
ncbi:MAG: ABC transporter substrate-binding protein, partial [Limisphaerales bacterium]